MEHTITRRGFVAGAGLTASSYLRTRGSNDRVRVAFVGVGARGRFLLDDSMPLARDANFEIAAVCDLWSRNRERAAAMVREGTGIAPKQVQYFEDVLRDKGIDGVVIATPDFAHSRLLTAAVRSGKDVYCEKPMGNVLSEVKEAYRTVKSSRQIVQVGTQDFSAGNYQAARDLIRSGKLGRVSRVAVEANFNGQRWRGVPDVKLIRREETDWNAWLLGHPPRPFDPQVYFEFRLYREFSSGIPDQWMGHYVAGAAYVMSDPFPASAVAEGGVLLYPDGRETSDTFSAQLIYSSGFLFSYTTMFGNDYPDSIRYYGQNGTITSDGETYHVSGAGAAGRQDQFNESYRLRPFEPVHHFKNWIDCMRSRQTPRADVSTGYSHSVAAIMAAKAEIAGQRVFWHPEREEIGFEPPTSAVIETTG